MAAKLKKRALAEYQSQTQVIDDPDVIVCESPSPDARKVVSQQPQPRKKLRLVLSRSSGSTSSNRSSFEISSSLSQFKDLSDLSSAIIKLLSVLPRLESQDVLKSVKRLCEIISRTTPGDGDTQEAFNRIRVQACLALGVVAERGTNIDETLAFLREFLKNSLDSFAKEKSPALLSSLLSLFASILSNDKMNFNRNVLEQLQELATSSLKVVDISQKMSALKLLGKLTTAYQAESPAIAKKIVAQIEKYTQSPDARVRLSAFEALLVAYEKGYLKSKPCVHAYRQFSQALMDDFDSVRLIALRLVFVLAKYHPDEKIKITSQSGGGGRKGGKSGSHGAHEHVRLVDDAFGKICNAINDLALHVRETAAHLIGDMENVSPEFLLQTLDKKLMSNMRVKKSAHEREARMVSSGEWSSGKKWADDAPREEIEADSVNLMSFGACGAFIHGLEDEFVAVRTAAIESLTKLSIKNPKLAAMALDFLVDMFNDEIELVRLKAIESLRRIASHIVLQVHQLETILSALDDYSVVVRERLHVMLQFSTVADKDGLQSVIHKLLENLKKYPQDKRSLLATFQKIGERHSDLTLPLVTQLLDIHPFFDTAEPDIDDPAYLCLLVLVFNAAQHCPTMTPLLDHHTKRHQQYLMDTYPHLMPAKEDEHIVEKHDNSEKFLQQTLRRITDTEHLSMANRIKLLQRCFEDLKRLGKIEPIMSDSTRFVEIYVQCQVIFLKTLASRFWTNPLAMSAQQLGVVESNIEELLNLCIQLKHSFINLNAKQIFQVRILSISILALQILFLVRASNKSALLITEQFLSEIQRLNNISSDETIVSSPFLSAIIRKLSEAEDHKPGMIARVAQPLLLAHPLEPVVYNPEVKLSRAVIYDPQGNNETPLKYTAGMVLAIPVDCEIHNVDDTSLVRLSIKTPDQKVQLVTPKPSQFFRLNDDESSGSNVYRLLTEALMSHSVWSESMHVEISVVLDVADKGNMGESRNFMPTRSIITLSHPVKVNIYPKAIKRGI